MKFLKKLFMPGGTYAMRKRIIALRARMIFDKRKRHRWKWIQNQKALDELVKRASWGVSYSVFDGEELLEDSIKSIRDDVDYINVVYQRHSWYGNPANPKLVNILNDLKKRGLIDELIEYVPDYNVNAGKQERIKRNIGLSYAKKRGVDYFMCMDTDEFYIQNDVRDAKNYIIKNGITHSFCPVVAYATPTRRSLTPGGCFVQFFSHIGPLSKLKYNKHNVALVDPTRQLNHTPFAKYYVLPRLEMHHMTGYRKNMTQKLKNSSFRGVNNMPAKAFNNVLLSNSVKVKNIFDIKEL